MPISVRRIGRLSVLLALVSLTFFGGESRAQFFPEQEPQNSELVFGCEPGPIEPFIGEDPPLPPPRLPDDERAATPATLVVDGGRSQPPIAGTGFNLEHTLWSCPTFRPSLRRHLEPLKPSVIRVDSGQLPLAPEGLTAEQLSWSHYQEMMASDRYEPSWDLIRRLNRQNIKVLLGVWGAPGAFNDDGTRRGALLPQYFDNYVEYYTAVIDFLVRIQGLSVWAATIMNEPDGGDGTYIAPDDLAEVARRLGPRLAAYGVKLYGPDTASAEDALDYLGPLLDDPDIAPYLAAVGTHQYFPSPWVERLVESVRASATGLPVYITEYTSFNFGSLDRGQEATDEVGFMLDSAATLLSLHNAGVDAALYWDAVDYYQAGHAAITRWGLLQGPDEAFYPRKRYFGMLQILPYLRPGARILSTYLPGVEQVTALALRPPGDGREDLAIVVVNQGGPVFLTLSLQNVSDIDQLQVYLTDDENDQNHLGRVEIQGGHGEIYLPARSIMTLAPAAAPDEE